MTLRNRLAVFLLTFMLPSMPIHLATAQPTGPPCALRREVVAELLSRYGEQPVAMGLQDDGKVLEVLASPQGSWSIVVTLPSGLSCLRASGVAWEMEARSTPVRRGILLPE